MAVAFLALPLIAIFTQGSLREGLRQPGAWTALKISFETSAISLALMVVFGTPIAYLLATTEFVGKTLLTTLFELPLVLPPAVAGLGLLMAFGRFGLVGSELSALGIELPFTKAAVVMAMTFVACPLYMRQAISAFAAIDPDLLDASRTLGGGPARTFLRVAVPVASPGLGAGGVLAWARAVGEFGATILFAGSLAGVTETAPVAIYLGFAQSLDQALALGALLIAVSAIVLVSAKLLIRGRALRFMPA
ncbi:MAG TPA: ABC transporter permease [Gaiellales bacterium]|nr:ABC transporter permease [Gaiellales bacterium]